VSIDRLVRLAVVLAVVAGSAGLGSLSQAAPLAVPSSPAAASSCSLPAFLQAPSPVPSQTSSNVCGCGDTICIGKLNLASCGSHRVCLATGSCSSATQSYCVCITQDPRP